jgi:hypothetical protein
MSLMTLGLMHWYLINISLKRKYEIISVFARILSE